MVLEAEVEEPTTGIEVPKAPACRVFGKRSVKAVSLRSEVLAAELMHSKSFTGEDCGQLLRLALGD